MPIVVTESLRVHAESFADIVDLLAWLADSEDNDLDNYPGPGWDEEGGER